MLDNIQTLEELLINASTIQNYLDCSVASDNPEEIIEQGHNIAAYLSLSAKMLADAKYHLDKAKKASVLLNAGKGFSPSIMKDLISSDTYEENYLVNWIDRLNSTCVHKIDWLRSVLSKMKEEMKAYNYGK